MPLNQLSKDLKESLILEAWVLAFEVLSCVTRTNERKIGWMKDTVCSDTCVTMNECTSIPLSGYCTPHERGYLDLVSVVSTYDVYDVP